MSAQQQQRRKGPIGGLIGLIGTGVGAAVEYHGHRKERKAAHSKATSSNEVDVVAGTSTSLDTAQHVVSEDLLPQYSQTVDSTSDHQLATGGPVSDDQKRLDDGSGSEFSDDSDLATPLEDDEEAWELDELAAASEPPSYEDAMKPGETEQTLIQEVLSSRTPIKVSALLPLPVIIPQRRPRNKSRGFVRAYAPVLDNVGISQATFLKFLKNFHKSSQANPCFDAIMIAAGIAGMAPSVIAMAVTTAVQFAAGVGKEIDSRRKTNHFLDAMNEELFKPAGCYAFIMKYKSDDEVAAAGPGLLARFGIASEQVDFSTSKAIAKYDNAGTPSPGLSAKMKNIRLVSGETRGTVQLPEAAPLIYPEVDEVLYTGENNTETLKDRARDAKKFLAAYADRRAQIAYTKDDPNSALLVPEADRQMKSKWSDGNHPMFNNGLVGLLSGGLIDLRDGKQRKREWKQERRELRHEYRNERRAQRAALDGVSPRREERLLERNERGERRMEKRYGARPEGDYFEGEAGLRTGGRRNGGARQRKGGPLGAVKKVLRQDVLYLMIVPMPSEAELAEAREALAAEKAKK